MITFTDTHNGAILFIPLALSTWFFGKRGMLLYIGIGVALLAVFHTFRLGGFHWPVVFILAFLGGIVILTLAGFALISLRDLLIEADTARQKAQEAERQTAVAYEQQRQLNQIKNQFMLNVNHELRTPLATVYGHLEILAMMLAQQGYLERSKHEKYVKNALTACEELRSLVHTVLDTLQANGDTGPIKLEALAVTSVVHTVLTQSDIFQAQQHRIHLEIPEGLIVQTNAHYIEHILRNLLSNAFKYSSPDTPVTIKAVLNAESPQGEPQVCISVKDEGLGIPPHEIPSLFGQFARLERDITGTVRGTGLGLYISKHLVEAMNGQIWVESSGIPGQGSRFCFTLYGALLPAPQPPSSHDKT